MTMDDFLPFNGETRWIGESFSPYKRPRLQKAYSSKDEACILNLARRQVNGGAAMLDVCASLVGDLKDRELTEAELFSWLIPLLQNSGMVPLLVDSWDFDIQIFAARFAAEPVILNSLSCRKGFEQVMEAAAKYHCGLVLMPLLEGRVPKNRKERYLGLEPLLSAAIKQGIPEGRILVDCVVLPKAKGDSHLEESIRFIEDCRKRGLSTIAGISNYSAGAEEERAPLNRECRQALSQAGLSWGITNTLRSFES